MEMEEYRGPVQRQRQRHNLNLPPGYRFKPNSEELIGFLFDRLHARPLTPGIFNDVDVLSSYPQDLHDEFLQYMENGNIHFFSERKFSKPTGKRERPIRATKRGSWKASGGAKQMTVITDDGVAIDALKRTLVFYNDKVDNKTGKRTKAAQMTDYALHEFMIKHPKTGKVIDLALYQLYKKAPNKKNADGAVDHHNDDGQGQFSAPPAPPPEPEMALVMMEPAAAMDVNAFYQCYGATTEPSCSQPVTMEKNEPAAIEDDPFAQYYYGPSCSQPEMPAAQPGSSQPVTMEKNEPVAMEDDPFAQYYYGPSCSQPEMPAAQPYYGYSHAAPAAVDPISFLGPVNQNTDEGMYLNGVDYVGLADGMPLEMMARSPDTTPWFQEILTSDLVEQMGSGTELIPWPPEQQPCALQQYHGAEDGAPPPPPPPEPQCVAEHGQEGVGSSTGDDALPPSETRTDSEINSVVIGNGSADADKKLGSSTLDFLTDGDPNCKEELEFCAKFMDA